MSVSDHLPRLPSFHQDSPHSLHSAASLSSASLSNLTEANWAPKEEDFDIQKPIGYGSSAVVYAALHKASNKRVAIKMIDLDMFERNQIDELRRETALMALSKHPNVLRVYGSFVSGSKLYIVTPYLSGGSCLDIMKTAFKDGFDEVTIATVLKQALEGLIYLHKNGHIHRDVKAGNLLMDDQGTVLLADFGVSSSLTENNELRKTFVGTPCWMAPEVMEQAGYDYKADIWSFGITAIELATGHAPFAKYPPMKVLMLTLSNAPPTLDREHAKHKYSKTFKEMIDMCLQKDPRKRPSAEKLLHHPFFKEAKKKDYLCKSVLARVPSLDNRPHKRFPQKQTSVQISEQWDFDDTQPASDTSESKTAQQQQQQQISSSQQAAMPKKHISFGEVVIRNPPQPQPSPLSESPPSSVHSSAPASTAATTPTTTTTASSEPTTALAPVKKSRFVVEDNRDGEQHNSVTSQRSISPQSDHPPSASPFMSPVTNADVNEMSATGLGISEVKKGRFSVNQAPHRQNSTTALANAAHATNGEEPDPSSSSVMSACEYRPLPVARVSSHDSLPERKSRFEVQKPTDQHVKFEGVPLSRDGSLPRSESHSRLSSRFSVDKESHNPPPQPTSSSAALVTSNASSSGAPGDPANPPPPAPAPSMSPDCRKKGRFELSGGSSSQSDKHEGSPTTSPCGSLSRGHRLQDSSIPYMIQSHMETMMKQIDAQKCLLHDMMLGMSVATGTTASERVARSRASSTDSRRSNPAVQEEGKAHTANQDISACIEHLQHLLLQSARERERLTRENESLRREVEILKSNGQSSNNASSSSNVNNK
ncbi:kinase-like domain-containing protein [Syncephalastrum racemosum]|uniref:Kinase-like domain-containing protein n=1 Tax=Syncephalastrum racemosum TaxID=13706 RepID=A0A1X2HJ96_SYNRA|nr:kinase-like domain-containing protein [Syncephalastrum racemosum]